MERRRTGAIHLHQNLTIQQDWEEIADLLKAKTQLKHLQLDIEECYCPIGCCRHVEFACEYLRGDWKLAMPEVVEIVGWLDEAEKKQIRRSLNPLNDRENAGIKFVGESIETWDIFNDPEEYP